VKEIANPKFGFGENAQRSFPLGPEERSPASCSDSRKYQCGNRIFSHDLTKKGEARPFWAFQVKNDDVRRICFIFCIAIRDRRQQQPPYQVLGRMACMTCRYNGGIVYDQDLDWEGLLWFCIINGIIFPT